MSNELGDCRKGLDVMRSWLICPSTMFKKYPPDRPPTKSIPTRRGISRTFWILASFSVFFWKSAYHRLGPMGIFVKIHGISWNITLSILPDMAELIWFLLPGYKIAVLNMSYLINLIQDIWSIQQLDSSMVRHICAQCAILCSTWLRFKIATKWTSLGMTMVTSSTGWWCCSSHQEVISRSKTKCFIMWRTKNSLLWFGVDLVQERPQISNDIE